MTSKPRTCFACGGAAEIGKFCPACGVDQSLVEVATLVDPQVGKVIAGRYEVLEQLGIGGMGAVYRAIQRSLDRVVAIKCIHPNRPGNSDFAVRFMGEAQAVSRLNHPNVVSVYDFGRADERDGGMLFLVMEYLSGADLNAVVYDEGPLPVERSIGIVRQVLAALSEAHRHGITHRDIKPENVFVQQRRVAPHRLPHGALMPPGGRDLVKVIDFGLASVAGAERVTVEGCVVGTPQYMSPEQALGRAASPAADLYACGVLLFFLLTGKCPFDGDEPAQVLHKHLTAERPDARRVRPELDIPGDLAILCQNAMSIDPARRPPDADVFSQMLEQFESGRPVSSRRSPIPTFGRASTQQLPVTNVDAKAQTLSTQWATARRRAPWVSSLTIRGEGEKRSAVIWGSVGVGKTWLMSQIESAVRAGERKVISVNAPLAPLDEISYLGARRLVEAIASEVGLPDVDLKEMSAEVVTGLAHYTAPPQRRPPESDLHRVTKDTLMFLIGWATSKVGAITLCLGDVDRLDNASYAAITEAVMEHSADWFTIASTTRRPADVWWTAGEVHELCGIGREELEATLAEPDRILKHLPPRSEYNPLYVEQLIRLVGSGAEGRTPESAAEAFAERLAGLDPDDLRILLVLAIMGPLDVAMLARVLKGRAQRSEVDAQVDRLKSLEFICDRAGCVELRNAMLGPIVHGMAPSGVVEELHRYARDTPELHQHAVELQAHHAMRAQVGFHDFMIAEEAAELRERYRDLEGAASVYADGVQAARTLMLRGEIELAMSSWSTLGRRLALLLVRLGRPAEAQGILSELLDCGALTEGVRAGALITQIEVLTALGRTEEAKEVRLAAIRSAVRANDPALIELLRKRPSDRPHRESLNSFSAPIRPDSVQPKRLLRKG